MKNLNIHLVEPQPSKRLLPYRDGLRGLFWAETGEGTRSSRNWYAPEWATACIHVSELTKTQCIALDSAVDTLDYCSGPACPTGPNGCNAKGCDGVREHFQKKHGDGWYWVE